jgi:uncharacterized membrane protein YkoI
MRVSFLIRVSLFGLTMISVVSAQERKIKRADLPPAVQKTVSAQSRGATIRGLSEEEENGHTYYELEMTTKGHSKDVLMDRNGAIVEIEESVAFDALPTSVQIGLQTLAGKGQLRKVESLTKRGTLVAYEAEIVTGGKRSEIQVDPDGRAVVTSE